MVIDLFRPQLVLGHRCRVLWPRVLELWGCPSLQRKDAHCTHVLMMWPFVSPLFFKWAVVSTSTLASGDTLVTTAHDRSFCGGLFTNVGR